MVIKRTLLVLASAVIIAATLAVAAKLFVAVAAAPQGLLLVAGPFFGAFFAFMFVRVGDAIKRYYDRRFKNHDCLVHLEHYLNDVASRIDDNIYLADGFINVVAPSVIEGGIIKASGNRLTSIPFDRELLLGLTNLDLINDLFAFQVNVRKVNDSAETLARQYDRAISYLAGSNKDVIEYRLNAERALEGMRFLRVGLSQAYDEALVLLAKIRLLARDLPFLAWLMRLFTRTRYSRDFEKKVQVERERLREEMEQSKLTSGQRIRAMEKAAGISPSS